MKNLKRIFAVVLCLTMLLTFAPAVFAENVKIDKVSTSFTIPADGEAIDFDSVTTPADVNYTAKIYSVYYYDYAAKEYVHLNDGDTVTKGVRYTVRIQFTADSGYQIADKAEFIINGEIVNTFGGINMPQVNFIAAEKTPSTPEDPAPSVSLWARIKSFFANLFAVISFPFIRVANWFRSLLGL